jgi:hypothetical protein
MHNARKTTLTMKSIVLKTTLISALRLLSDSNTVAASSCMPASVIADPLYADSENITTIGANATQKTGKKISAVSTNVMWSVVPSLSS